jgi:hypothetical protein
MHNDQFTYHVRTQASDRADIGSSSGLFENGCFRCVHQKCYGAKCSQESDLKEYIRIAHRFSGGRTFNVVAAAETHRWCGFSCDGNGGGACRQLGVQVRRQVQLGLYLYTCPAHETFIIIERF